MKKRIAALICAALMSTFVLTGCGGKTTTTETPTTTGTTSQSETIVQTSSGTDFPTKDITIVVPYDAGGGVDNTTRLMVDAIGKINGHSIIVQNVSGGGGAIGQTTVKNSDPDGYTLLAYTSSVVNNPQLKEVDFVLEDFRPLVCVCFDPEVVLVPADSPYNTFEELIAAAQEQTINVSTSGAMTSHHLDGVRIQMATGADFAYIHCDSAATQKQELIGGHTDAAIFPLGEISDAIQDGTVKPLAIALSERSEDFPDIPTYAECGIDLVDGAFRGFACPAGVPEAEYQVLKDAFEEVAQSQSFIDSMDQAGIPYLYMGADEFQQYAEDASVALADVVAYLNG
jgi:tripartite-type tricarboxylate transporter receptor subunit TctC